MTAASERVHSGLGPTRAAVLGYLRGAAEPQSVVAVATALGLHPNSARFHLDALTGQGLAALQHEKRTSPGRPRRLYTAEPEPPADPIGLPGLAAALVRHLDRLGDGSGDEAEAAGRFWGQELAAAEPDGPPLDRVVGTLGRLGYQPVVEREPAETIVLTPCPLAALQATPADGRIPAVCRLHLGLMRGLLADDPDLAVAGLEPWATPTSCVARLERRSDG